MNELINEEEIKKMIYEIRGKQVMLDFDLAKIYKCANGTKSINLAVKRHIRRFPERFMFQLTEEESKIIWFQFETKYGKSETRGGRFNKPYVFTEQGTAMLSTVLKTKVAEEVSIKIMDAFVAMRHYIGNDLLNQKYYNEMTIRHDSEIKKLQKFFDRMEENKEINEIYFNGKIYDAYSKVIDLFKEAKEELIIIDRFTDKTILDMIKNLNCKVILITSDKSKLTKIDIEKYNNDYHNLNIYYDDTFHDRYFIIDKDKIYHSGNSVNHIGYRKSSINILSDSSIKNNLINDVNKIIGDKNE